MLLATFRLLTASLLQAMGSTGFGAALCMVVVCCDWLISILLFSFCAVSSDVRLYVAHRWFWCFLMVVIQALGISNPLSLLMLLGLRLMWIASFTFLVYQCFSLSINFTSFQSGLCPVMFACSETAEF